MKTTLLVALMACLGAMSEAAAVEVTVGGRLHLDYARYNADVRQLDNGMLLRRARLDMDGKLTSDWSFELAYDFANVYALTNTGTVKDGDFKGRLHRHRVALRRLEASRSQRWPNQGAVRAGGIEQFECHQLH